MPADFILLQRMSGKGHPYGKDSDVMRLHCLYSDVTRPNETITSYMRHPEHARDFTLTVPMLKRTNLILA